jgi:hypothetical protein
MATTTSTAAGFTVTGGQILGPNGQPFISKGINIYSDQLAEYGAAAVTSTFPGVNFIRLNIFDLTANTASSLQTEIQQLTSQGIVVELEDHNYPTVLTGSNLTTAANWYASLATAFKGNPYVWFGTQNEPDTSQGTGAVDTEISTIYNAIRGTGSNAMILMNPSGGFTTSGLNPGVYSGMTNVAWDLHYYNWIANNSTSEAANAQALTNEVNSAQALTKDANGTIPVVIGEYGISSGALGAVNDPGGIQVIQAVEASAFGSAAWAWTSGDPSFPILLTSPFGDPTKGLTQFGLMVEQFIAAGAAAAGGTASAGVGTGTVTAGGAASAGVGTGTVAATPSADGTKITTASVSPIIDKSGNAWTLVQSASKGLQIAVNGTVDPISANVVLLEITGGKIVQENTAGNWYTIAAPGGVWTRIAAPPAPNPDGTKTTAAAAGPIIDQAGNAWTLVQSASKGLQIAVNGTVDPITANVVLLETLGGKIVQENSAGLWYSTAGPGAVWTRIAAPAVPPTPSPDGTEIAAAAAGSIIDQAGNAWTLVQSASKGLQIAVNGTIDPITANVALLETLGGKMVQETTTGLWYSEPGLGGAWTRIAAPTPVTPVAPGSTPASVPVAATPSVSETGDHGSLTENLSQTGTFTVGGDTFVLSSGNTAFVMLGTGTSQIKFIGASSVMLTGGSGQATVTANGGANWFVAGSGALDVTGGAGKDVYEFHANGGLMTIEDFSLAKGDTLIVDKSLQGAMQQASDGHGGTMLTFGTGATHGVDIHGLATMPTTSILWA